MKAVIYARYSSDKQDEYSIEGQLKDCYSYASKNNIEIVKEYIDRAKTGTNDKREEFQRMIVDSADGNFEQILVWKIDRFARNLEMTLKYKRMLKENGVKVVSINEPESDDASGFLTSSMFSMFAEWYSIDLSQKMKRGQKIKAQECLYLGGLVPYGFKIVNQKFELDPDTAPIVQEAFKLYAEGISLKEICKTFNDRGLRNARGNLFNKNSFSSIFTNKRYNGYYIHDPVEIKDGIPKMIDDSLWEAVQIRANKNKKNSGGNRAKADYLLADKIFCGCCGDNMLGTSARTRDSITYHYYTCRNKKNYKTCNKKNVNKEQIEDKVIDSTIDFILRDKKIVDKISHECYIEYKNILENNSAVISLNKQILGVTKSINNLMSAIESGVITSTTKSRLLELENQKEKLEVQIQKESSKTYNVKLEDIQNFFIHLGEMCKLKSNRRNIKIRKALVNSFVKKVIVYDNGEFEVFYTCIDYKSRGEILDIDCNEPPFGYN